jgi:hypothetical protein
MSQNKPIRRVAIIGTGVIGAIDELEAERDEVLLGLLELRKKVAKSSQTKSREPVA